MKTSYICPYVHYIKQRGSLQGHSGSFISLGGTFGEVMWKGEAKRQVPGGTPRKKWTCRAPRALGAGASPMVPTEHPAPRARLPPASAAPSAIHPPARRTPSPAALLDLRPARQDAEEVTQVLGEDLPERRASEPGAVGGGRALRPRPVDALSPRAASAVRLLRAGPARPAWPDGAADRPGSLLCKMVLVVTPWVSRYVRASYPPMRK
jgi:hypothetical protein